MTLQTAAPMPGATLQDRLGLELKFTEMYSLKEHLQSGTFGAVYTASSLQSGNEVAVKVIDRTKLKRDGESVFREVSVMKELMDVPHVVQLIDFFVEKSTFYIVLVYYKGGDVFDRLSRRSYYTEKDARDLAGMLLHAVHAMHSRRIVHRDIKPENMLLLHPDDDATIVVADFGFARRMPTRSSDEMDDDDDNDDFPLQTRCGTPCYLAPEVAGRYNYNHQADMWSVGVVLYMLLAGHLPFEGKTQRVLFDKIQAGDYVFHEDHWRGVSVQAKQLVEGLLTVDPRERMTAKQALHSDWMTQCSDDDLSIRSLDGALSEIREFHARRALKSAAWGIRWAVSAPFWHADANAFAQQMMVWDLEDSNSSLGKSDATTSEITMSE